MNRRRVIVDTGRRPKVNFRRIQTPARLSDNLTVHGHVGARVAVAIDFCKTYLGADPMLLELQAKAQYAGWRPNRAERGLIDAARATEGPKPVRSTLRRQRHAVEFLRRQDVSDDQMLDTLKAHLISHPEWRPSPAQLEVVEHAMGRATPRPGVSKAAA